MKKAVLWIYVLALVHQFPRLFDHVSQSTSTLYTPLFFCRMPSRIWYVRVEKKCWIAVVGQKTPRIKRTKEWNIDFFSCCFCPITRARVPPIALFLFEGRAGAAYSFDPRYRPSNTIHFLSSILKSILLNGHFSFLSLSFNSFLLYEWGCWWRD